MIRIKKMEEQQNNKPYDEEQYKIYFDEAKKRFPNLEDFLIHLGVVSLLTNAEADEEKGEEIKKNYFKDDIYEGIELKPIETQ